MEERWYLSVSYDDAKTYIRNNLQNIARDYIALGYYLRVVQAGELYREDNYRNIHEFALEEFGLARSTVNHCMRVNAEFSKDGNSPIVDVRYREFSKSQLQEMLYIPEELRDDVKPDMTVKEIRALDEKRLDIEPEQKKDQQGKEPKPYEGRGCITGWSRYPDFCSCCGYGGAECCSQCDKDCNSRCGWINEPYVPEETEGDIATADEGGCQEEYEAEADVSVNQDIEEKELDPSAGCPPEQHSCPRNNWGLSEKEQQEGQKECDKCWNVWKERQKVLEGSNASGTEEPAESCPEGDVISEQQITDGCQETVPEMEAYEVMDDSAEKDTGDETGTETTVDCDECTDSSRISDYELIREQWHTAEVKLSKLLTSCTDEDIKVRKQKMLVMALAGYMYEYEQEAARESFQPELPNFRNNDQRKEWLRNYKEWGLWYEDKHIGCRFYKYDFKNGARLIAEVYNVPKTSWYDEHDNSYLHLVGGPEPPKAGGCVCKWQRHETYNKFPNSETELVEFLKYVQKEG